LRNIFPTCANPQQRDFKISLAIFAAKATGGQGGGLGVESVCRGDFIAFSFWLE
jgi:hypothetical protein